MKAVVFHGIGDIRIIANAASWPGKVADGRPRPVAFMAVCVAPR